MSQMSETYKRGLSVTRAAGVRVIHGDDHLEVNAPVKVALIAIDNEIERARDRLNELIEARRAIVRSSGKIR